MIGKKLAHYEVIEKIGAGGMGEVWLVRDTKLDRNVAIKVLPTEFAQDPDRLGRFEREAKFLASLNHPGIASIYGLEQDTGVHFLVLEHIEGDTLGARLKRGRLPVREALEVARQIAIAIEAAHAQGIIHRDLKPANIKFTSGGKVKVLDFGLAKDFDSDGTGSNSSLSMSPTITPSPTVTGVIMGTAGYMSPEQARGKPVDKRSDIWSFGGVLLEMLTGRSAFEGETVSDTIAAVLKSEPNWDALPAETPRGVRRLLERCLQKDANRRLHDIADARIELEDALAAIERVETEGGSASSIAHDAGDASTGAGIGAARTSASSKRGPTAILLPVILALALAASLWQNFRGGIEGRSESPDLRFTIQRPELSSFLEYTDVAISPDGTTIAFAIGVPDGNRGVVYTRRLDSFETELVDGADFERFGDLAFSDDGRWIAYMTSDGHLKKIPIRGGSPTTIARAGAARGLDWHGDELVYAPSAGGGLFLVASDGGEPTQITRPDTDAGEVSHRLPHFLPGGNAILFTIKTGLIESFDDAILAVLDRETGTVKKLVDGGADARYASTGHIVYGRDGKLLAVPFDLASLTVTGAPVPVLDDVYFHALSGHTGFALSRDGTLVYSPGGRYEPTGALYWIDRAGRVEELIDPSRTITEPTISPDGSRIAMQISGANDKLWTVDVGRKTMSRLTSGPGNDWGPVWTPDGSRIVFTSDRSGKLGLYSVSSYGGASPELLYENPNFKMPSSVLPDNRTLVFVELNTGTGWDVYTVSLEGGEEPEPWLATPDDEIGTLSPDGSVMALQSDESGRMEVYVTSFPDRGPRLQISTEGGRGVCWREDGRELYYLVGDRVRAVSVTPGPPLRVGDSYDPIDAPPGFRVVQRFNYDTKDGERFLVRWLDETGDPPKHLNVALNWFDELREHAIK